MTVNWCTKVSENNWIYQKQEFIHSFPQMVNIWRSSLDHPLGGLYTGVDEYAGLKTNY